MAEMKAYEVSDKNRYVDYTLVVFAESRGKAISSAIGTEEFPKYDWDFTELRARRIPVLDKAYRGNWRMDWLNDADRLAFVKDAGFYCNDDCFDPDDCEQCAGKEYCTRYEEYLEEENEYDHCYESRGLGDDYIINDDGELESYCDRCGCNPDLKEGDEGC